MYTFPLQNLAREVFKEKVSSYIPSGLHVYRCWSGYSLLIMEVHASKGSFVHKETEIYNVYDIYMLS